jgi:polar amino acid transport system permease protein
MNQVADARVGLGVRLGGPPRIWGGMVVIIQATLLGITIAMILGLFLALGRRSQRRWIAWPFAAFIDFIRSTPLLIQLFFVFFALPELGIVLDKP